MIHMLLYLLHAKVLHLSFSRHMSDNRNPLGQDCGGIGCLLAETSCIFQPLTTVNPSTQSFGTNISYRWLPQFDVVSLKKRSEVDNNGLEEISYAPTYSEKNKILSFETDITPSCVSHLVASATRKSLLLTCTNCTHVQEAAFCEWANIPSLELPSLVSWRTSVCINTILDHCGAAKHNVALTAGYNITLGNCCWLA